MASPDFAHDAQRLVRALDGVVDASVRGGPDGIHAIHVTARDADAARSLAARVRSALLAGLATPVTVTRIHVRVHDDAGAAREWTPEGDEPGPAAGPGAAGQEGETPRHRIWLVEPRSRPRPAPLSARMADHPRPRDPDAEAGAAWEGPPDAGDERPPLIRRPRLVSAELERPGDGRVVCRVSVAYGTAVHRAEAVAVDLPGAAAQAAAQAAVRALVQAGLEGLELDGLREVEIAGRHYVLVALGSRDTSTRHRSGSAPIIGSPERSAAEAAVAAADALI